MRTFPPLRLAGDTGYHEVAFWPYARLTHGLCRHDDAGQAPLHVLNPVAVQEIPFDAGGPGIAPPAHRQGVDVDMAVQHQAAPAAGPFQCGDGLETARLDLLQVDLIAPGAEEVREKPGHRRFFGLEAGNADEGAGQLDHRIPVNVGEHPLLQCVIHRVPPSGGWYGTMTRS